MGEGVELVKEGEGAEELLRALQEGKPEARDQLWERVRRFAPSVFRRRGVRGEEQLEELLHAVLESALRVATRLGWRPRKNLAGFLKGRARGVFSVWAREERNKRMSREAERLPEGLDGIEGSTASPAEVVEQADENRALGERIRHCRDRLDPSLYLPVWKLRYEEELDLAETSRRLKRKYDTVAVQVHRINQLMRECMRTGGFEQ